MSDKGFPPGYFRATSRIEHPIWPTDRPISTHKVLADIPKNKSEIPRVGLSEFKGHNLAYARVFYEGEDGKLLPTKKGVTFKLWMLPALFEALQRTEDEARKAGLLTDKAA